MFRNRYGVVMAVFSGILLCAFAFPPYLNLCRSAAPDHVTFYIKCYMVQKILASKGFFGSAEACRGAVKQIPESKKRCGQPM
jgi:hypothetical protein